MLGSRTQEGKKNICKEKQYHLAQVPGTFTDTILFMSPKCGKEPVISHVMSEEQRPAKVK